MTARISILGDRLTVERTGLTRWIGGSVEVPLAHVTSVAAADAPAIRSWFKGIRLTGVQLPGVMTSGLFRQGGDTVWWEVGRGSAIVLTLRDERLTKVIVEVEAPAATVRALGDAVAAALGSDTAGR